MAENKTESCIFCKIANSTIPSYKVYEDNDIIAFLDVNPVSKGHTLVLPKEHIRNITTCPKDLLDKAFRVAQLIAQAEITQLGASGVNVITNCGAAAGQSVDHFHIHVIPRFENDGLKLGFEPGKLEDADMKQICYSIKEGI